MFRVIFLSSQCKNEKGLERMVRDLSANRFPAFPPIWHCKLVKQAYKTKISVQSGLGRKPFQFLRMKKQITLSVALV